MTRGVIVRLLSCIVSKSRRAVVGGGGGDGGHTTHIDHPICTRLPRGVISSIYSIGSNGDGGGGGRGPGDYASKPSQMDSSQVKRSQVKPNRVKPNRVKSLGRRVPSYDRKHQRRTSPAAAQTKPNHPTLATPPLQGLRMVPKRSTNLAYSAV